jgi:hypothetical protein
MRLMAKPNTIVVVCCHVCNNGIATTGPSLLAQQPAVKQPRMMSHVEPLNSAQWLWQPVGQPWCSTSGGQKSTMTKSAESRSMKRMVVICEHTFVP